MIKALSNISGYILMGGRSRRLGLDKAWIEVDGMPLWRRTSWIARGEVGSKPILVGDSLAPDKHQGFGLLRDAKPGKGPLGGLVSALRNCKKEWALVLAVDLPLMQAPDLRRLLSTRRGNYDIITLSADGRVEPLAALYRKPTLEFWEDRLKRNELSLHEGIDQLAWKLVRLPKGSRALFNLNVPEDVEKLMG
jgi:molybdopterin-guanine dinucleotide biosynthesis protein A